MHGPDKGTGLENTGVVDLQGKSICTVDTGKRSIVFSYIHQHRWRELIGLKSFFILDSMMLLLGVPTLSKHCLDLRVL